MNYMKNNKRRIIAVLASLAMSVSIGAYGQTAYGDDKGIEDNVIASSVSAEYSNSSYQMTRAIEPVTMDINIKGVMEPGSTVCADINLYGLNDWRKAKMGMFFIKYNTDIFEDAKVERGNLIDDYIEKYGIIEHGNNDVFLSSVHNSTGKISMLLDCFDKDRPPISKGGELARLYLKVKDNYCGSKDTKIKIDEYDNLITDSDNEEWSVDSEIYDETTIPKAASKVSIDIQEDKETISSTINPKFVITNTSDKELDLSNVKFKYFYTKEGEADEVFNCYYAGTIDGTYKNLTSNVVGKIVKLDDNEKSSYENSYIQLSFNGGILEAGQSMAFQAVVNKIDWSNYDKSNDLSYKYKTIS